jgi:hypothetical protein
MARGIGGGAGNLAALPIAIGAGEYGGLPPIAYWGMDGPIGLIALAGGVPP